jgi:hypothetical protein
MSDESAGAQPPRGTEAVADEEATQQEDQPIPVEDAETWRMFHEATRVSFGNVVRGGTVFLGDLAGAAPWRSWLVSLPSPRVPASRSAWRTHSRTAVSVRSKS